jgi:hypothetical protein
VPRLAPAASARRPGDRLDTVRIDRITDLFIAERSLVEYWISRSGKTDILKSFGPFGHNGR